VRPTVQIAFDLAVGGGGDFFTLNDPVKGELDDAPFGLAGDAFVDVTDDVRSVTFRRGRSSETQTVDSGIANVVLDNRTRQYDPLVGPDVSIYAPSIIPRKALIVELLGERVFTGQIEDWDLQYSRDGDSVSIAKTADAFALISQQAYSASFVAASALSGEAVFNAASVAGWPLGRVDLDVGTSVIGQNDVAFDTTVLSYLQLISESENGLLFMGKQGSLTFRDRTSALIRTDVLFSDDGTGIPFTDIEIEYGTEFLYTRVEVEWTGGQVEAEDLTASEDYGVTTLKVRTLLGSETDAEDFATFLVERYRQPTVRITGLTVEMRAITPTQQRSLIDLDIGSVVFVRFTPNGIGDPIFRELRIDSIEHAIVPGDHVARFRLFEPFLRRFDGSVLGTSSTDGFVLGVKGKAGSVFGSSGSDGSTTGEKGAEGSATGTSGTTGSVDGVALSTFVLDTSLLDGDDRLTA
jgi:hypothetical protein